MSGKNSHKKKKKEELDPAVLKILSRRNELLDKATTAEDKEKVHLACKGLFTCKKTQDPKCFEKIEHALDKVDSGEKPKKASKSGGAVRRKKSRSHSRSRRRSKSHCKK
jgi:hypothetical protein